MFDPNPIICNVLRCVQINGYEGCVARIDGSPRLFDIASALVDTARNGVTTCVDSPGMTAQVEHAIEQVILQVVLVNIQPNPSAVLS